MRDGLLHALAHGATGEEVAPAVAYAAIRRVGQFPVSNEFGEGKTSLKRKGANGAERRSAAT